MIEIEPILDARIDELRKALDAIGGALDKEEQDIAAMMLGWAEQQRVVVGIYGETFRVPKDRGHPKSLGLRHQ